MKVHTDPPRVNPGGDPISVQASPRRDGRLNYPFDPIPADLKRTPGLQPVDHLVLAVLLGFRTTYRDSAWCAIPTIAAWLPGRGGRPAACDRTVQRSLRRLQAAGAIDHRRVAEPGRPDPDEPRNRTGWRFFFRFMAAASAAGPAPTEVVTSRSLPPVSSKSPPPVSPESPKEDVVVESEGIQTDAPQPPRGGPGTEDPRQRQRSDDPLAKAPSPAPASIQSPSEAHPPSGSPGSGPVRPANPPGLAAGLANSWAGLAAASIPPPGAAPPERTDPGSLSPPAIGSLAWRARLWRAQPATPAAARAAGTSRRRVRADERQLEVLAAEDPIIRGELQRRKAAREAAAARAAATRGREPPGDLAELLARIGEEPSYRIEASCRLVEVFGDHASRRFYEKLCAEACRAGGLDPAALAEVYRKARGPGIADPKRYFAKAIQDHRPRVR